MIPPKPRPAVDLMPRNMEVLRAAPLPNPPVVVAITTRTPPGPELERCLGSVLEQTLSAGVVLVLDGLDAAPIGKQLSLPPALEDRTWLLAAHCGTASRARNAALEFIDVTLSGVRWVARLDVDDTFADRRALEAAVALGERAGSVAVLGGNRVLSREGLHLRDNPVSAQLLERPTLEALTRGMAAGTAPNELPSCNLLMRACGGLRYPDMQSAEDHWLVAELLFHRPDEIAILESPLFVDYRLDGLATEDARQTRRYREAREALHQAVATWARVAKLPGVLLGLGQEGIVRCHDGVVYKHFYRDILSKEKVDWLRGALAASEVTPSPEFSRDTELDAWVASYPWERTEAFTGSDRTAVEDFLCRCLKQELVCANVKRSNYRVRADGSLVYIDIGNWIVPMDVSYFRDAAARLYSIGVLGASDGELLRRRTDPNGAAVWTQLPGFSALYGDVVGGWIQRAWDRVELPSAAPQSRYQEVTLLIKACAMDARDLRVQVVHIVDQLTQPCSFSERVLLIDPFEGPFLRQYARGDLDSLFRQARELVAAGVVDRVLVGPTDEGTVHSVNQTWFGVAATHTHSADGVPVTPQVWAFDQLQTRYVLQADVDVLVGRRNLDHDYLAEMLSACTPEDVTGVAFNIPHPPGYRPYGAPRGEYKPEVRLGLLDLHRLRALRPLPAQAQHGRLTTTWYRALHAAQRARGLRTLRGGDGATFYLHPPNERKHDVVALSRIRDLVAQARIPPEQLGKWDLEAPGQDWTYPRRAEKVVVIALGRNTPQAKLQRFARGLAIQDHSTFGVVVVNDASDVGWPSKVRRAVSWLGERLTLVNNAARRGLAKNYQLAVRELCTNPETMIVVVDLDDALAHPSAISEVERLGDAGHDVVLAAPFRPDAPTHVYSPDFERPRETYGGDVWIHLRAFRKRLFDALADADLQLDGRWLNAQIDYATMIPIVEQARAPIYLPRYRYWHERTTVLDEVGERERDAAILGILAKRPDGDAP